ncbi:MAG: YheU family protein [Pseudomonadota bacterium]
MIKVSWNELSDAALLGVIDDFVLREGTDYGNTEVPLATKREQVRRQLEQGTAAIWFDPHTSTVTLRAVDESADP